MGVLLAAGIGAAGAIGGAMISANSADKQSEKSMAQREAAYNRARDYVGGLAGMGEGWLAKAFGDELNPEAFLYHKVDLTGSQLDTISGNLKAAKPAIELTNKVNPSIWNNDLSRIRTLMPQFDKSRDSYLGTTRMLQEGKLPFSDVMDITSATSSSAASSGIPGGSRNATLRDLGLSRLDAMERGNSMFAQFMQIAQQISPVEHQMRPQQMMFTPQERAAMDIEQAALDQQGRASAEMARAMPDPAQNAIVNAQMGIEMAAMGSQYQPSAGGAMLGAGIQQGLGFAANAMMQNQSSKQQQSLYSGSAPQQPYGYGYGGGYGYSSTMPQTMIMEPSSTTQFNPQTEITPMQQPVLDYYPSF